MQWWTDGVLYQIYPRSFRDTNGDGVGDLRGVIEKLDYLEWLGVSGVWLSPIMASPNDDWGYDVSDYKSVHPDLGTIEDVDELISEAGKHGIKIVFDFVPNHTSSEHEWFKRSRESRDSEYRDFYVWADAKPDGSPPNNWVSTFGGSAWEYDEKTEQYYLHNFLPTQPDLNWWNEDVRVAMDDILRFWFDRGVAGFRIDVAHGVVKDKELRDNLPATEDDLPVIRKLGQRQIYNMDRPEVHDVIRRWRQLADSYDPPRVLIGETFLLDLARVATYYGTGDELHLAFNFPFALASFDYAALAEVVDLTYSLLPELAWPVWTGSNHDILRFPTRWCEGDDRKTRLALILLLTLRGTPILYSGDEIGMTDVEIPDDQLKDPVGKRPWAAERVRDQGRTPMQWTGADGAGFSAPGVEPWLPFGDYRARNVEGQKNDPGSILSLTRALIRLCASEDLREGGYERVGSPKGTWVYRRGGQTTVALNMSDHPETIDAGDGSVALCTNRSRDGEAIRGTTTLQPWEGMILRGT